MITVRTKSSLNVKEVVRFFNRNFPEAVLKVSSLPCRRIVPCQPPAGVPAAFPPRDSARGPSVGWWEGVWAGGLGGHLLVPRRSGTTPRPSTS